MWNRQYNPRGEWQQGYNSPPQDDEPTWQRVDDFVSRIHWFVESSRMSGVPQSDIAEWLRPLDEHIAVAIRDERNETRAAKMRLIQSQVHVRRMRKW